MVGSGSSYELEPPNEFKTKQQLKDLRHNRRNSAKDDFKRNSNFNIHFQKKVEDETSRRKRRHARKDDDDYALIEIKPEEWREELQAGVRLWTNKVTGEVSLTDPNLLDCYSLDPVEGIVASRDNHNVVQLPPLLAPSSASTATTALPITTSHARHSYVPAPQQQLHGKSQRQRPHTAGNSSSASFSGLYPLQPLQPNATRDSFQLFGTEDPANNNNSGHDAKVHSKSFPAARKSFAATPMSMLLASMEEVDHLGEVNEAELMFGTGALINDRISNVDDLFRKLDASLTTVKRTRPATAHT